MGTTKVVVVVVVGEKQDGYGVLGVSLALRNLQVCSR
jgi:hypothetical protein